MNEPQVARNGLTLQEAARYLGVSPSTVRRIVARGELPAARVGGRKRGRLILLRSDLDAYLERRKSVFNESRRRE